MNIAIDFETFCGDSQLINEPISKPWAIFYSVIEGLPLDEEGVEIFLACTGRDSYQPRIYTEATAICGRRSEKTSTGIKYALFKALTGGYEKMVRPGELLRIPIVGQDLRLSRDIKRTAEAMLLNSPVLANEVDEILSNEIRLRNGVAFTCFPCTHRSTRGLAIPVSLLDEINFWVVEGASDVEVLKSIRPGMVQFGNGRRLVKFSTPWQRSGLLYAEFSRRSEHPDLLVWHASTAFMTPRISREVLEAERAADPSYFAREYEAQFVDDLEAFLPTADIDAAVWEHRELPPVDDLKGRYSAALDASSLTGRDRFTLGIAHSQSLGPTSQDGSGCMVDLLRGWTRAPVPLVCDEIASVCKSYGVTSIDADQYASEFLGELMRQRGIGLNKISFTGSS